jgi:AcrR family transcriptional regulator
MPRTLSPADVETFRARLCDVAEKLFAAHGPDGVTMREMTDALGVSSMTPYRYFKDKDAILADVRTRAFNRFAAAMESARKATMPQSDNPYVEFALANPAAYRLMFDVSQPTFAEYPDLVKAMDRARLTMGGGLRELAATGRFKGDLELAAYVYWSAMHGAVMLELAGLLQGGKLDARKIAKPAVEALGKHFGIRTDS